MRFWEDASRSKVLTGTEPPLPSVSPSNSPHTSTSRRPHPAQKKILVDDDDKHLLTTKELLEFAGYEVVVPNSPFRISEVVKAATSDLIILDVNMPALSGDRLCSLLKWHSSAINLPVLLYSSNDEDSLRRSVVEFGADGYVCKGDVVGLRRLVNRNLNG